MGLLQQVAEEQRAITAAPSTSNIGIDDRFWKTYAYAFRLLGPPAEVPGGEAIFPLVLNPRTYSEELPFALELTATQEGGVFAEEAGIVIGELIIEGTTGFKPRLLPGLPGGGDGGVAVPLSGQAHFMRLRDVCFKRYSELKKDPTLAPRTSMTFHNFKDNTHYFVKPRNFTLRRDATTRVLYNYSIRCAIVAELTRQPSRRVSEDAGVVDRVLDVLKAIPISLATANGAVLDFAVFGQDLIRPYFKGIDETIAEFRGLVGAVGETVRGVRSFINRPVGIVDNILDGLEQARSVARDVGSIPADVAEMLLEMEDAIFRFRSFPELFVESFEEGLRRRQRLRQGPGALPQEALDNAEAALTPADPVRTSAARPGDKARKEGGAFVPTEVDPDYEGFTEGIVEEGDTLPGIAAKTLGDARRWGDLADINGLKPPYISTSGQPGTLKPGDPIQIPKPPGGLANPPIKTSGNPDKSGSQIEAYLGTDLLLQRVGKQFGLVIDVAGGSIDFKTVTGVPEVGQAITLILNIELGTDTMFQNLGVDRLVGKKGTLTRAIETEFRVIEAIQNDPRVNRILKVEFDLTDDVLTIEMDVVLVNTSARRVRAQVIS